MTQPGITYPPQPGWWARTAKIGVCVGTYKWAAATPLGVETPVGHSSGTYSWSSSVVGVKTPRYLGGGTKQSSTSSPNTWTETIPARTRLAIIWSIDEGTDTSVSASIGGTAMTLFQSSHFETFGGDWYLRCWTLLLPLGSALVGTPQTFSVSIGPTVAEIVAATAYYGNVGSLGPAAAVTGGTNLSLSQTIASSDPNQLYAQAFTYAYGADTISGYNQTQRSPSSLLTGSASNGPLVFGDALGNGGTLTFSASRSDNTYHSAGIVVPMLAPVGGEIIAPAGIPSGEGFGSATIRLANQIVTPTGITSGEAFGTATVTPGGVTVSPTGIASTEAFGTAAVKNMLQFLSPTGIGSAEAFGTAVVGLDTHQTLTPTGITSGEAFGTATVTPGTVTVAPTGIASAEAFGTATVTPGTVSISPTGIASAEAFGTATVATAAVMSLTGANSGSGTSIAIPTHAVGDTILIFAYRDGSNTVPSKPTPSGTVPAWNDIDASSGSSSNSCRLASFVATATNHTSGTWTNATGMIAAVVSGAYGAGNEAQQGGTTTTSAVAPNVAQTVRSGTPLYLSFFGHRTLSAWGTVPSGYTLQTSSTTGDVALLSDNDSSSVGSVTMPCTSTGAGYRAIQVEILPTIPAPSAGSTEVNVVRSSVAVPSGLSSGIYMTAIAPGAAGGTGGDGFSSGGAGGGGGGSRINRTLIPLSALSSTFSVSIGAPGTTPAADAGNIVFTSGTTTVTAGGGKGGKNAPTSSGAASTAGGAGGTVSASGVTVSGVNGTAGGAAGWSGNGGAGGSDTTNNVGCGGGGGSDNGFNGGVGGSSNTVSGGAGGVNGGAAGATPADASAGNGGAGGGGGGTGTAGGNGGAFGGGGGGGAVTSTAPGVGAIGYVKLEFV